MVDSLAVGGAGVARLEGWPLFVESAAPGDRGVVEVVHAGARYGLGRWVDLARPSELRRPDPCPHASLCGGCDWPFLPDDRRVEWKVRLFRESLRRIGRFGDAERIELPIDRFPMAYRLRSRIKIGRDAAGEIVAGFYARKSRVPFRIERCEIVSEATSRLLPALREALAPLDLLPEEVGIVESPSGDEQALRAVGEGIDVEQTADRLAPLARGARVVDGASGREAVRGNPFVTIPVAGIPHRVSANSFFQVNRFALDRFVERVAAPLPESFGRLWDLYCGAGFFALPLARRAERVVAVEVEGASLADGRATAANIGCGKIDWVAGSVERFLGSPAAADLPEVVVVDPPRSGLGKEVRNRLALLPARRLVYVSCDPPSFARDLTSLLEGGWRLEGIVLLDLFPGTWHVESVAHFRRP